MDDRAWERLADAAEDVFVEAHTLARADVELSSLKERLDDPAGRAKALLLLELLDTSATERVIDILLPLALSERYALRVRQILGRVPFGEAVALLQPHLRAGLRTADSLDCRRYAELALHRPRG